MIQDDDTASHPASDVAKPSIWKRINAWFRQRSMTIGLIFLTSLFLLVYLYKYIFISLGPGEVGILWSRFFGGTQVEKIHNEGLHIIPPWDRMYIHTIRLQQESSTFNVLTKRGLHIGVDMTVRFQIVYDNIGHLHKYVGLDYIENLLLPEVESHAREEIALYTAEQLYSASRQELRQKILDKMNAEIVSRYTPEGEELVFINIEDILIQGIVLPAGIREAISDKLEQEQVAFEYNYVLAREKKEKQRKKIEAEGIRLFQDIVSEGISDKYLRWRGIDATLRLAESDNSKIVIIGGGDSGLPIILGGFAGDDFSQQASAGAEGDTDLSLSELTRADLSPPQLSLPETSLSDPPSKGGVRLGVPPSRGDLAAPPELPRRGPTPESSSLNPATAGATAESSAWQNLWDQLTKTPPTPPSKQPG